MAYKVRTLCVLAAEKSVIDASVLQRDLDRIPPCLYDTLLLSAITTNRILSIGCLLLSWPLQELSLVDCKQFTVEHATMMAHSLQKGCNKLRIIDLSGCNIGVLGTKMFLSLAAGLTLPRCSSYGVSNGDQAYGNENDQSQLDNNSTKAAIKLKADFYVDAVNYHLFLDVLKNNLPGILDFDISCLHVMGTGNKRTEKLFRTIAGSHMTNVQVVNGLDLTMNSIRDLDVSESRCHLRGLLREEHLKKPHPWRCRFCELFYFSNLRYLNLSDNLIMAWGLYIILSKLSSMTRLTHLILNNCGINENDDGNIIQKISQLPCITQLQHFELAGNPIRRLVVVFMKLFQQCARTLVHLNMEKTSLHFCWTEIKELLRPPFHLNILKISNNFVVPPEIAQFDNISCVTIEVL